MGFIDCSMPCSENKLSYCNLAADLISRSIALDSVILPFNRMIPKVNNSGEREYLTAYRPVYKTKGINSNV